MAVVGVTRDCRQTLMLSDAVNITARLEQGGPDEVLVFGFVLGVFIAILPTWSIRRACYIMRWPQSPLIMFERCLTWRQGSNVKRSTGAHSPCISGVASGWYLHGVM